MATWPLRVSLSLGSLRGHRAPGRAAHPVQSLSSDGSVCAGGSSRVWADSTPGCSRWCASLGIHAAWVVYHIHAEHGAGRPDAGMTPSSLHHLSQVAPPRRERAEGWPRGPDWGHPEGTHTTCSHISSAVESLVPGARGGEEDRPGVKAPEMPPRCLCAAGDPAVPAEGGWSRLCPLNWPWKHPGFLVMALVCLPWDRKAPELWRQEGRTRRVGQR